MKARKFLNDYGLESISWSITNAGEGFVNSHIEMNSGYGPALRFDFYSRKNKTANTKGLCVLKDEIEKFLNTLMGQEMKLGQTMKIETEKDTKVRNDSDTFDPFSEESLHNYLDLPKKVKMKVKKGVKL